VKIIKSALLDKLRESTNKLQTQLDNSKTKAIQNIIPPLIRDAIISLAYAIGFAGMGYSRNGNSSLLRRLLNANKPTLSKGRQLWGPERP
jgi:GH24 family phage-related lysozyme (muramidase)